MADLDLICVGNAIVDILTEVDDDFLKLYHLDKGSMSIMSNKQFNNLFSKIKNYTIKSGGSAANTAVGFSSFGGKSSFIGRVGNDNFGNEFKNDLQNSNVEFLNNSILRSNASTSKSLIFVSKDGERTMCTNLDASNYMLFQNFDFSIFKKNSLLYIEGYLFDLDETKNTLIEICKYGKENGLIISLSLSDSFCVNRHREDFISLIENYIDILFANESELNALCACEYDLVRSQDFLKEIVEKSVITFGSNGSKIFTNEGIINIPSVKTTRVTDTTGAGDIYASGFLFGISKNFSLNDCGFLASKAASQIIQHFGARPKYDLFKLI